MSVSRTFGRLLQKTSLKVQSIGCCRKSNNWHKATALCLLLLHTHSVWGMCTKIAFNKIFACAISVCTHDESLLPLHERRVVKWRYNFFLLEKIILFSCYVWTKLLAENWQDIGRWVLITLECILTDGWLQVFVVSLFWLCSIMWSYKYSTAHHSHTLLLHHSKIYTSFKDATRIASQFELYCKCHFSNWHFCRIIYSSWTFLSWHNLDIWWTQCVLLTLMICMSRFTLKVVSHFFEISISDAVTAT